MSNETQWTPGPWHANAHKGGEYEADITGWDRGHNGYVRTVAVILKYANVDERAANARLIAAAPEMAELLEQIMIQCDSMQAGGSSDVMDWQDAARVGADQCRALLAKIKGAAHA